MFRSHLFGRNSHIAGFLICNYEIINCTVLLIANNFGSTIGIFKVFMFFCFHSQTLLAAFIKGRRTYCYVIHSKNVVTKIKWWWGAFRLYYYGLTTLYQFSLPFSKCTFCSIPQTK